MADNVTLPGTGAVVASDEVDGAQYQIIKLALGADGVATLVALGQALMAASVPVVIASNQSAVPVSAASLPLPSGASTAALQGGGLPAALGAGGGLKVDGSGTALPVSLASVPSHAVTNAGTFAVQVDGDALTALQTLDNIVSGSEAQVDVVAALPAGENVIGLVGASDIVVTVAPTLDTNAYASGDLLFDSAEVANAVRANGGYAILQSVTVLDKADQGVAFTLLIADAATDFGAANSAPDPDDTEAATVLGWIPIAAADYVDLGASKVACVRNLGLTLKAGAATTSLYIAGINGTGTPTYGAAGDLVIKLGLLRS